MSDGSTQAAAGSLAPQIQRYLEAAVYLLILTGFGALASTGGVDIITVTAVGTALALRGLLVARRKSWILPERWTSILTIACVAFFVLDYFLLSGAFLTATVHLLLFVMMIRLFSARRDRDQYFLAVVAFLMVLAAAVMTVDSSFLLTFGAFVLTSVATFVLMEMRHSNAKASNSARNKPDLGRGRRMGYALSSTAILLAVFMLLCASLFFFLLPRASAGYLSSYSPGNLVSTGFSDNVQLGRIGQIQQSSSTIMHVQLDGEQKDVLDLKLRGVTLSRFNGKSWSNPQQKFVVPRRPDGSFALSRKSGANTRNAVLRPLHYRVWVEPIGTNVFFLAATPSLLQGDYRAVAIDDGSAVFDLDSEHPVGRYEASSVLPQPDKQNPEVAGAEMPLPAEALYLQLPPLDARIPQLASQITKSAPNDYDRARALEAYLRTQFGYTLQLPRVTPRDPLANFLFERKEGHCEYFASAMAVMLRTLRIPSRVVNGFRLGEYNDLTSQYVVRGSDAHSWVEAYLPGYGWVSFDPTPPGASLPTSRWARAMLYLDALSSTWREWIVNYDLGHQVALGRGAAHTGQEAFERVQDWGASQYDALLERARRAHAALSAAPKKWSALCFILLLLALLLINARPLWTIYWNRRMAANPRNFPQQSAVIWFERMTRVVAQRGWEKALEQTPQEFISTIDDPLLQTHVARFIHTYQAARFGNSREDASRLPELYRQILRPR
ncbi:MAG: DUF3488 domain-containing protein [Acidobacteriales bacterium]|nr:DUF3488 domain-containing protein [Terriglobales bacterium]